MTTQIITQGIKENLLNLTLREIVTSNYNAAAVFEKYNFDFCCKGNILLSDLLIDKAITDNVILDELENVFTDENLTDIRYDDWSLDFLVSYIINNHHSFIRRMLPVLNTRAIKISSNHPEKYPWVLEVRDILAEVTNELTHHMIKEEQILFPYVLELVEAKNEKRKVNIPPFSSAVNPIKMMEREHQNAGDELYSIRKLTNNYTAPEDACTTFKLFYSELKAFEEDLHKHVHLENNLLFPKTIELEKELM